MQVSTVVEAVGSEWAARALRRIGPATNAAVPAVIEALNDGTAAAFALWQINRHPVAVDALAEGLKDHTDGANHSVRFVLHYIGPEAKAAVPALASLGPRGQASRTARRYGLTLWQVNKIPAAVPVLVAAVQDGKSLGHTRQRRPCLLNDKYGLGG